MTHTLSVIIPTYNAATDIGEALTSLIHQTVPAEIIVVDDGSVDETVTIVKGFPSVTCIQISHQGPAIARNRGAEAATGTILVFVDADMTFAPDFLAKLTQPIQSGQSIGTFTKEELVANWDKPLAKAWNIEYTKVLDRHRLPPKYPDHAPVFRAIVTSKFVEVGGFDAVGYTDDWTLSKKLGVQATAAADAVIYHHNPDAWTKVWQQAQWIAKRQYKWGELGRVIGLVRALLPVSVAAGTWYALKVGYWPYLPFKLWYDLAIVTGIVNYWITGSHAK